MPQKSCHQIDSITGPKVEMTVIGNAEHSATPFCIVIIVPQNIKFVKKKQKEKWNRNDDTQCRQKRKHLARTRMTFCVAEVALMSPPPKRKSARKERFFSLVESNVIKSNIKMRWVNPHTKQPPQRY